MFRNHNHTVTRAQCNAVILVFSPQAGITWLNSKGLEGTNLGGHESRGHESRGT